eukprot:385852-Alexandrium_andersonii.AAC.1
MSASAAHRGNRHHDPPEAAPVGFSPPLQGDTGATVCLLARVFSMMLMKAGLNEFDSPPHYG